MATDQDRDRFIETFWAIRNPDPNSPTNTAREEHYQRLDYANTHYGLTFGAKWMAHRPRHGVHHARPPRSRSVPTQTLPTWCPIETWFYQDPANALAPYFSVLFFKRSGAEDFKIYSPYQDRPEKLIASTNAINDEPDRAQDHQADPGGRGR